MRSSGIRLAVMTITTLLSRPACAADLPPLSPPAPPPRNAMWWNRLYLSLHGGAGVLQDTSIDYVNNVLPNRSLNFDPGWTVAGAVGFQVTPWWRTELEIGQRSNGIHDISPGIAAGGSASATTLMANAYLDLPNRSPITPYLGAGVGKAWLSHDLAVDGGTLTPAGNTVWPWAYQVMVGANLALATRWTVGAEYRFLSAQRSSFQDAQGLFYNASYNNHSFLVGLTWRPL